MRQQGSVEIAVQYYYERHQGTVKRCKTRTE